MVRFKLILLAAVTVVCLQFGVQTQAERQCDDNDGRFSLPEQILLFPISLFDNNRCARDLDDVADTTTIGWYRYLASFIENVHGAFTMFSRTVEDFTSYGVALLYDWRQIGGAWVYDLNIPNRVTSFIQSVNPAPFFSQYLTYIWNLDPTGSVVHVLTIYSMSLLPTCIPVSEQLANILPSDIIATISSAVSRACLELVKNPSWALRVLTAVLIAVSLPLSLYRKYRNNTHWKQRQSMKYVREHHLMCEIFDDEKCNCGGKYVDTSATSNDKDVALHYRMCESYDKLACNCGGIVQVIEYPIPPVIVDEVISEPIHDSDLLVNAGTDVDAVSNTDHTTGTCMDVNDHLGPECVYIATALEQNILDCSKECTLPCPSIENYPTKIDNMVDTATLSRGTKSAHDKQVDSEKIEFVKLVRGHYQMCECFDGLQCNCGGRSLSLSQVSELCTEKLNTEIKQRNTENTSEQNASSTPLKQNGHKDNRQTSLDNDSPDIVYFDYGTYDSPGYCEHATDGADVRSDIRQDGTGIELYDDTEDLTESSIGAPVCNSSFRDESHYVTVNRDVSIEDTYAGGDGLSTFSTLTRRSPYLEHGLEDLVSDDSFLDAETSILDVSSINNSLSFTTGDGIFEFAVIFVAQTACRLLYRLWKKKFSVRNTRDITAVEASPGLYLVKQKNKSKQDFSSSYYRNNSATVDDDGVCHVDKEEQEEDLTGKDVENECAARSDSDGNNNAGENRGLPTSEHNEHIAILSTEQQSDEIQQSDRDVAAAAAGNHDSENLEDFKTTPGKKSKFKILLEKAGLVNRNIWELGDDRSANMNTDRSRLLAWAWSGMGNK